VADVLVDGIQSEMLIVVTSIGMQGHHRMGHYIELMRLSSVWC
jgi:hypothetical protein